jgi:hypothetical protein
VRAVERGVRFAARRFAVSPSAALDPAGTHGGQPDARPNNAWPRPHGHWRTTTFVAGLRQSGIVAPLVLDAPMTR